LRSGRKERATCRWLGRLFAFFLALLSPFRALRLRNAGDGFAMMNPLMVRRLRVAGEINFAPTNIAHIFENEAFEVGRAK
jgi:hypothetical protein